MSIFNPAEIYQFAVRIEENGEQFYRAKAKSTDNAALKELFLELADDEADHKKTFNDMLSQIEKYEPLESYPEEYFTYLRAYADHKIFPQDKFIDLARQLKGAQTCLDFALDREFDSILYYQEMKNMVDKQYAPLIEKIVNEERTHVSKLTAKKAQL